MDKRAVEIWPCITGTVLRENPIEKLLSYFSLDLNFMERFLNMTELFRNIVCMFCFIVCICIFLCRI